MPTKPSIRAKSSHLLLGAFVSLWALMGSPEYANANMSAIEASSRYLEKEGEYLTTGSFVLDIPFEVVSQVGGDFASYNTWALRDINGGRDNPRKFLVLFRKLLFENHQKDKNFKVIYDLDVPLVGRENAVLLMAVTSTSYKLSEQRGSTGPGRKQPLITSFKLAMSGDNFALNKMEFEAHILPFDQKTRLNFAGRMQLSRWVNWAFDLERYRTNVEWRFKRIIANLYAQITFLATQSSPTKTNSANR